jgi:DNA-binding XRE family transcriptional regulator
MNWKQIIIELGSVMSQKDIAKNISVDNATITRLKNNQVEDMKYGPAIKLIALYKKNKRKIRMKAA